MKYALICFKSFKLSTVVVKGKWKFRKAWNSVEIYLNLLFFLNVEDSQLLWPEDYSYFDITIKFYQTKTNLVNFPGSPGSSNPELMSKTKINSEIKFII